MIIIIIRNSVDISDTDDTYIAKILLRCHETHKAMRDTFCHRKKENSFIEQKMKNN